MIGIDAVLENRVRFGSVTADVVDWHDAVERLGPRTRWPEALERFVGQRVPLDGFANASRSAASTRS